MAAFRGPLLAPLVPFLIHVDRRRLREVVLDQAVLQLFARDPRGLLCPWVFDQRRRAGHELPRTPPRQYHIRKLALRSFCLHSHCDHTLPNDPRSCSTLPPRPALLHPRPLTIASPSRPPRSPSP